MDTAGANEHQVDRGAGGEIVPFGRPPWQYSYTDELAVLHASKTVITLTELNRAAGLAWRVYQTPAYIYIGDPPGPTLDPHGYVTDPEIGRRFKRVGEPGDTALTPAFGLLMNVRDDVHTVLGVVKKRYRIFQNDEAPLFLDQAAESGGMLWETAAALHGGAQVWWLMKSPDHYDVAGDHREALASYILLTNSHDGSAGMTVAALSLRLGSNTTLAWVLPTAPRTAAVSHTDSSTGREIQAEKAILLARSYQFELNELADRLLHTELTEEGFTAFLNTLVPTPTPRKSGKGIGNQRGITMAENTKGLITQVYYNNESQSHLVGTLWGAVQACQFYADHFTINRNTDTATAAENRFKRLTSEANLGSRVFTFALTLL